MRTRRRDLERGLDHLNHGCWCVVTDMTKRVLSWKEIGSCPSWQVRFAEIIEAAATAGWQLEQVKPDFNNFFCRRDGLRAHVSLQSTAPRNPLDEWAVPQQAASLQQCFAIQSIPTERVGRTRLPESSRHDYPVASFKAEEM